MARIRLLHAKLHRVRVTDANVDYVGSVTIDQYLLGLVGILPLQTVEIWNATNGQRLTTYAIPGLAHSGIICVNGAAAHLCQVGDIVIIAAFEEKERQAVFTDGHQARVIIPNAANQCHKLLAQTLMTTSQGVKMTETELPF